MRKNVKPEDPKKGTVVDDIDDDEKTEEQARGKLKPQGEEKEEAEFQARPLPTNQHTQKGNKKNKDKGGEFGFFRSCPIEIELLRKPVFRRLPMSKFELSCQWEVAEAKANKKLVEEGKPHCDIGAAHYLLNQFVEAKSGVVNVEDITHFIMVSFNLPASAFRYFTVNIDTWTDEMVKKLRLDLGFVWDVVKPLLLSTCFFRKGPTLEQAFEIHWQDSELSLTFKHGYKSGRGFHYFVADPKQASEYWNKRDDGKFKHVVAIDKHPNKDFLDETLLKFLAPSLQEVQADAIVDHNWLNNSENKKKLMILLIAIYKLAQHVHSCIQCKTGILHCRSNNTHGLIDQAFSVFEKLRNTHFNCIFLDGEPATHSEFHSRDDLGDQCFSQISFLKKNLKRDPEGKKETKEKPKAPDAFYRVWTRYLSGLKSSSQRQQEGIEDNKKELEKIAKALPLPITQMGKEMKKNEAKEDSEKESLSSKSAISTDAHTPTKDVSSFGGINYSPPPSPTSEKKMITVTKEHSNKQNSVVVENDDGPSEHSFYGNESDEEISSTLDRKKDPHKSESSDEMEIDNFGDISDSDDSMPDLEDMHRDTETDHQFAVQSQCGLAPPILRPETPYWQKTIENGSENPSAHLGIILMNIDQNSQNHASAPTKPYVSVLDYDDELNALVNNSISEWHRAAMESQQVQERQDQQLTNKNQSTPTTPIARSVNPMQSESIKQSSDNPNGHPEVEEGSKSPGNQDTEIFWDFDMDTQTFVRIDRPLRRSDSASSMRSVQASPQAQLTEKDDPGPAPPVVRPVTPIRADQMESHFQDEIVHEGMQTKKSVPTPGYMPPDKNQPGSAPLVVRLVTPIRAAERNTRDGLGNPGMIVGNSAIIPSYMSPDQDRPGPALHMARPVAPNWADQMSPNSQNKAVQRRMYFKSSALVSGNLWTDKNQPGPAPPITKPVTQNSGDEIEYLGSFIGNNFRTDLPSLPGPATPFPATIASNSLALNGNPGPSHPFTGGVEVMDLTSPLPSPPPFTLPPEVTAIDSQARIKQLNELYMWQSKQTDIWKRKTDEMQMYCEKQYQDKMAMQKEMKVLTARLSLFDESVSNTPSSFEEVLKEWEQSEFKNKKMEGIDLNLFLFNPKGVQTIPQVVRRPVSCYNLFRIHFHLKNDPEALRQEWKLMKFQSRDKIWFGNCEWINKWQKMQELKGWIRPIKVKESSNSCS
ncbi:hypothetical protein CAEBREN_07100 [Caenorhabditis brenneri]|uniref:Uncharacterized protein n=1 Tax=Caenorhabditis brenneri TaxID=135651 RepID=G0PJ71_CAEBE|nr:hypothetical protein CAEBREN_07100 [Caenorhabditis brenneri]